ncbi:MAG: single-stranded DNA-binding protein [Ruminococcaceae bacterium]|nr:single-stranded DNA-binding protein [Oscillospiraceae bacterium]
MNKVILMGRLTRDPELRTTPNGVSVCSFSIAVNRRFKNAAGEYDADFINCVAWRQTGEFVSRYFAKGRMIGVIGSLQTRTYEKDGQKRYATEVQVDEAYFAGDKAGESGGAAPAPRTQDNGVGFGMDDGFMPMPADDDLPF